MKGRLFFLILVVVVILAFVVYSSHKQAEALDKIKNFQCGNLYTTRGTDISTEVIDSNEDYVVLKIKKSEFGLKGHLEQTPCE